MLVIEDAVGFVVDYRVVDNGVLDQDLVVPVMKKLQKRFDGKIKSASFDRAFHTPENQQDLAEIVRTPCIAAKGQEKGRQQQKEGTVAFRKARQHHPGVESAIGALQAGNGLKRCRDRSKRGYERYVALGILGRNLQTLGKLLLAQDQADCQAAKSKRKREPVSERSADRTVTNERSPRGAVPSTNRRRLGSRTTKQLGSSMSTACHTSHHGGKLENGLFPTDTS